MSNSERTAEWETECAYLATLYRQLDTESAQVTTELTSVLRRPCADAQQRWQRETEVNHLSRRASQLRGAERNLCFGRLDRVDGTAAYIGRIGLFDAGQEYEPLLMDWRAPAAGAFYRATAAHPEGVWRRRHFRTSGRALVDFHDDFLDAAGETTLMAALNAPRDSRMRDVVATIQAEQDEIIRLDGTGVVVIEGGPGTGKTAVALHRVAYLLYHHREQLSRRGVLVVGPNAGFLDYISRVLPSLGETDVVFATPGELFPGLHTTRVEAPEVARIKGDPRMVDVLANAVANRQEIPTEPIELELDDVPVQINAEIATSARDRARATGLPHNRAQPIYRTALVEALARQAVDRIGAGWLEPDDVHVRAELTADVRFELSAKPELDEAMDRLWPVLTPQRLLGELFSSPDRLGAIGLDEHAQRLLYRDEGQNWSVSDVPLLDEAVEFLGEVEPPAEPDETRHTRYADGVLQILEIDDPDGETLQAADLIDAEWLAERHTEGDHRSLAERAVLDRTWTYGHVVLDEAQELTAMDWRLLMRRCPSRSMTVVGDLAQRQSAGGARDWDEMLRPYVEQRWTYRELTVNYRTPAEVMEMAAEVLAVIDPTLTPPKSVRRNGVAPWSVECTAATLPAQIARLSGQGAALPGTMAVIGPDAADGVWLPGEVKGLEFDTVLVVEPQRILAELGPAELYVTLTRATQRVWMLHTDPLPAMLRRFVAGQAGSGGQERSCAADDTPMDAAEECPNW